MKKTAIRIAAAALVILGAGGAVAQEASEDAIDEEALGIVLEALEHIASSESFSFVEDVSWDVLQDDGRMLEFGVNRNVAVRRPDRLRVDSESREEGKRGLRFDGDRVVVFDPEENVYAWAPGRDKLATLLDFVGEQLQMPVPNAEMLHRNAPEIVKKEIRGASLVDEVVLQGTPCHHVTLRARETDLQLWIQRDGAPILHRIVITYKHEEGMPQFTARFVSWDFNAVLPDSHFVFEAAAGAERIPFLVRRSQTEKGAKQ
jgi:hypothetical protein